MRKPISLAGVMGYPVAHSLSPIIHNYWFRAHGFTGYYVPLDVARADFETIVKCLPKMGFRGVNVTIPHKESVLDCCKQISDRASLIGAANTIIVRPDRSLYADNTDGYGFLMNIWDRKPDWDPSSGAAVVIGAGGASRAVIYALLKRKAPIVHLVNRTRFRAEFLQMEFGRKVKVQEWKDLPALVGEAAIIINTTALGMHGKPDLEFDMSRIKSTTVVNDLVYTPLHTKFLREASKHGCCVVDGLGMLLHQAAASFDLWFRIKPVVDWNLREFVLAT